MAEPTYFGAHLASSAGLTSRPLPREGGRGDGSQIATDDGDRKVAIIGGGLAGMALALTLHRHGIAAVIHDTRARGAARNDPRVLALSHGSQQTFEWLGVWPQIAGAATPIATIHISQQGNFGRTRITAQEQGVPALGQVVAAGHIAGVLDEAIHADGIEYREQTHIEGIHADTQQIVLRTQAGTEHTARLAVYAEGGIAATGNATAAKTIDRDYDQHALICHVSANAPHQGIAYERFTPQGPLALLPCAGTNTNSYAVVYTCAPDEAKRLQALSDSDFLVALQRHFGTRLHFVSATSRHVFPLGLRYRASPIGARCVWLGNAAQTLHPVAGQGFNLALRDIRDLARTLADSTDPGAVATLQRYAVTRRLDRAGVIGFTDSLVRLFSNDTPLLREARGLSLLALDMAPSLRGFVARRMMYGLRY